MNIMLLWIADVLKAVFTFKLEYKLEKKENVWVLESMLCSTAEWKAFAESKLPPLMKSYRGSESN